MSDVFIHVQNAAALLEDQDVPFRERFLRAARAFWQAMYDPGEWPPELLGKANHIAERLLQDGTIDATARNLDDTNAKQIAQRIVCLADDLKMHLASEHRRAETQATSEFKQDPGSAMIRELAAQDARLQQILGVPRESLFACTPEALDAFYRYLVRHLVLPFRANRCDPASETLTMHFVVVLEVLDPQSHPNEGGILCRVFAQGEFAEVPLAELEVSPECRNYSLLDDYWCWIWNSQSWRSPLQNS